MKIFTYASRILKAKSLAIPAVGAGLYGIPISICAQIFHRAIIEFSSKREENTILEDIRIVLYDVEATGEFLLEFCNTEPDDTDALGLKIDRSKLDQELSDLEPITVALPDRSTELHDNATYLPGSIHKKSTGGVVLLSTNVKKINPAMDRDKIATSVTAGGICKICSKDKASLKSMNCCKETLCDNCFKNHFKRKGKCPFCTTLVLVIEGLQPPDGKMDFKKESEYDLPGYENAGSIVVDYYFPDGVQEKGHPNPGKPYNGMRLRAYLPANGHGLEVLTLLQKAFDHRLLFKIGTTENENSVVSNDVHHKTNPAGGPANHGYPDSTYLDRVKEELAAKGVQ
ncbi:probable E3 ubiquitin-protein ligase DTX3 [Ptychodera flava]|uniref:probable E3 ubiquitin-protein ligase DTX3 n=1 Tax=Ptychodera flava TaxID=63121 RepID=UPI003969E578